MMKNNRLQNIVLIGLISVFFSIEGFADNIGLKKKGESVKVEILEERVDSFVVEISKEEIEWITRDKPTEVELWKEKKILWEDKGDYISILLPKEKIVTPGLEDNEYIYKEGESFGRDKTRVMLEGLSSAGAEPANISDLSLFEGKGRVTGRAVNRGIPAVGVKVKIVYSKGQMNLFSKLFSDKEGSVEGEKDLVFETETNEEGVYFFRNVPLGDYDIYWLYPGRAAWVRTLTEKAPISVRPGRTFEYKETDISKFPR